MIPISFSNRPTIFTVSILLNVLLLLFSQSQSSSPLEINHHNSNSASYSFPMPTIQQKKLLRLPHVFSQVLELPLRSQADVFIEDQFDCIRFVANVKNNEFSRKLRVHVVKIHLGVTKVVVNHGGDVDLLLEKSKVDVWRFRLPEITRPELTTAVVVGRKLIVTVPKGDRGSFGG